MKQHPKLWANVLFAAVVLAAAGLLFFLRSSRPGSAKLEAELTYGDANTVLPISLAKDAAYDVDTGYLTVHIQVQDGAARFVDSPCPDHLCENFGWLSRAGDWAACLPAKASLTLLEPGR